MANIDDDDNNDTLHTQGLSQEELAALEDDTDPNDAEALAELADDPDEDDDPAATAAAKDDDDLDPDDDDDDPEDDTATAADAKPAATTDKATIPDGDAVDAEDDLDAPEFRSVYSVEPVVDFDQKMADFESQKKALRAQFTDGTIDIDAYEEQKDKITAQEQALREQNLKYTIAVEQAEQNNKARWEWVQDQFFRAEVNAIYKNKLVMASLDTAVRDLASQPENANKSGVWFLKEADRQVREAMGIGKAETPAKTPSKAEVTAQKRKPDLSKIPPNLGGLPAAEISETGTGEFAHLENLDGMKLEQALAKLSPEEQARYLEATA